jgi:hypothetical protein
MAARAALMRLLSVDSETMRPCQTSAMSSSRLTTRSRAAIRKASLGDELVAADDAVACRDQKGGQVEYLRLDLDRRGAAMELAPADVQDAILE